MALRHSVTWRIATQDELERTECTDKANLIDGAAAVLVDGELVGICNEYGTCVWYSAPGCERCIVQAEEVRVVGWDHRNVSRESECPDCGRLWNEDTVATINEEAKSKDAIERLNEATADL